MIEHRDAHRLLSFEQAVSAIAPSNVQLSPDGKHVVYVTSPASRDGEHSSSTIWIAAVDEGSKPRRLTTSEAADGSPRWSPDGRQIAFLSDRRQRGLHQLYVIDIDGGEALQLTDLRHSVRDALWSPDGTMLAYTTTDPGTDDADTPPSGAPRVLDHGVPLSGLWVLSVPADLGSLTPACLPATRRISPPNLHVSSYMDGGFSWSPDGVEFVALVAASPRAADVCMPDMVLISMQGEVTRLGSFQELLWRPKFSPDGQTIAFMASENDTGLAFFSLQTISRSGDQRSILVQGHEGSFHCMEWLPSGQELLVIVEERQRHRLALVSADPRTPLIRDAIQPLERPGTIGAWGAPAMSLSRDGRRIAFLYKDEQSAGDVYVANLGGDAQRLTTLNPWITDYEYGALREVTWVSSDGLEIQGLLALPVGYQPGMRYPLFVHVHGGPSDAWTFGFLASSGAWAQFFAQRGYAVLMPNPRGSSGRGTAFLTANIGTIGGMDWQDIITGVDALIEQGIADEDRLAIGGWSYGGFMTNWAITQTNRFKAAVSGAGTANWISKQGTSDLRSVNDLYLGPVAENPEPHWAASPIRYIRNAKTPLLLLHGEGDERVPSGQAHEMCAGLKAIGTEVQMVIYPSEGHGLSARRNQVDLLQRVVDWCDQHLSHRR